MTELLTAAQMRAVEAAAIASGVVTGLELMERAGRGVVDAVFAEWPELAASSFKAVVLCGPGNNGGDGFVVARLLKEGGWEVEVFLYGDADRLPPDARINYERWVGMGEVRDIERWQERKLIRPALLVDAIFGIGLNRPFYGVAGNAWDISDYNEFPREHLVFVGRYSNTAVVAIDIPSGLDADSGEFIDDPSAKDDPWSWLRPPLPMAHLTVTFHKPKVGHMSATAGEKCGRLVVVDIGLSEWDSVLGLPNGA